MLRLKLKRSVWTISASNAGALLTRRDEPEFRAVVAIEVAPESKIA
jgi:hypothetical protein